MTDINFITHRYLALWFPFLPTDRLRIERTAGQDRPHNTGADQPLALVTKVRGALRLAAVNRNAQMLGIIPGMALADARAQQPDLAVESMDDAADRHLLQKLARRCLDWSPIVTAAPPDGITLDITAVTHLFDGEAGLASVIEENLTEKGINLQIACASTPEAAQALARYAQLPAADERQAIHALPIAALGLGEDACLALHRAGLKRVEHIATRPAASIAARFGAEAVTALRRLLGDECAPVEQIAHPAPLYFERRFAEPIALQSTVADCFMDLLREAAAELEQRDLGGRRFVLTLLRSDGARHRLVIETGQPTRDPMLVLRLFDERIAALTDPLDPGFGYDKITLFLPVTQPLMASQPALDGQEDAAGQLAELIDRLSTRLGPQSLVRLAPRNSHLPEQAQLTLPAVEQPQPASWPTPPAGEPPMRPIFLFDPPQPVQVIAEVPDGPPHRFRWRRKLHEVRLYEGPERIASEWWRHKGGEHPGQGGLTRDYYRIEDVRGRRYWIFRHGLYHEKSDPRWYMHGLFA